MSNYEHEILPAEHWTSQGVDSLILHDPVSGEPMKPLFPPDFLLQNMRLATGRSAVGELLSHTNVAVAYSAGEFNAADLGPVEGDLSYEAFISDPRYNIQVVGHTVDGVVLDQNNGRRRLADAIGQGSYPERLYAATEPASLAVVCGGLAVEATGLQPDTRTERAIRKMIDMAAAEYNESGNSNVHMVMNIIAKNAAQWYRSLSLAEQFGELSFKMQLQGEQLENILVVAPIQDSDYVRKLDMLGFYDVAEQHLVEGARSGMDSAQAAVMEDGHIPYELLD